MVSLRDDLDAENIRDGNTLPIRHLDHAVDRVDPLDRSDDSLVAAAVLPFVRHKVGDGHRGPAGKQLLEALQFRVHSRHFIFVHFYTLIRQPPGFRNGGAVTSQSGKGRELRRTVMEGHSRMFWRIRMGQMDNVFIFSAQALCPPICLFRSLAVAPSR